jgi:uncharacterized protein (DUF952 family)
MRIFHITRRAEWEASSPDEPYRPASLESEGFVHCSYADQVAGSAARHFAGEHDLLVLEIDPSRLDAPLVVEDTTGTGTEFPHVYGPVARSCVLAVRPITDFRTGAASPDR